MKGYQLVQLLCLFKSNIAPRGNGVMDGTLACNAGGRGSIHVVGCNLSILMVFSLSRVSGLGSPKIGPRHVEMVL